MCPAAGSGVRCIVSGGPECGFPSRVDFGKCGEEMASALNGFGGRWCRRGCVGPGALMGGWKVGVFKIVDRRIKFYSQNTNPLPPGPGSAFRHLGRGVRDFRGGGGGVFWFQQTGPQTTLLLFDGYIILTL